MAGTTSGLGWMAWTWQTAVFCIFIGVLLAGMVVWEWRSPGGAPRPGVLHIVTTRGDRLFISPLSPANTHPAPPAILGTPLRGTTVATSAGASPALRYASTRLPPRNLRRGHP